MNLLPFGGPRAKGGPVDPKKAYMVGEKVPELFIPNVAGSIKPNGALAFPTLNFSIDARGAQTGVAQQIEAKLRQFGAGEYGRTTANVQRAKKHRAN